MSARRIGRLLACGLTAVLTACTIGPSIIEQEIEDGAPQQSVDLSSVPDAVPKVEPRSRYGNRASYVVNGRRYQTLRSSSGYVERGIASWYGRKFHGRLTSTREPYDMYAMTAAHRSLPLPAYVRVTHLGNGRSVVVRVNDRGPFHPNRIIDLSYAAAKRLGMTESGTAMVEVRAIDPRAPVIAQAPVIEPGSRPSLFLQVGAFGEHGNAQRLHRRLDGRLREAPVKIATESHSGQTLYKVHIGPLDSVARADAITLELDRLGIREPLLVVK